MNFILTTASQIARIKERAKELRKHFSSLGHARDHAAREAGYSDYHHAYTSAVRTAQERLTGVEQTGDVEIARVAISRLPEVLSREPAINICSPRMQALFARSAGLVMIREDMRFFQLNGGKEYFRMAVADDEARLKLAGYTPDKTSHHPRQIHLADAFWAEILTDAEREQYALLVNYSAVMTLAGYLRGLQQHQSHDAEALVEVLNAVISATNIDEALDVVLSDGAMRMELSSNKNLHTGTDDLEHPSTVWSRLEASISTNMAGVVAHFPYALIADSMKDGGRPPLPFFTQIVPLGVEQREEYERAAMRRYVDLTSTLGASTSAYKPPKQQSPRG